MKNLKIGDKLWNGGYPTMTYEVTAVIKREKNTQYEILCESCNHSDKCRLLITKDDYGHLVYVGMVNEDEESDNRQYYFHKHNGNFYLTKEEAEIEKVEKYILDCDTEIKKHKDGIEYQEKRKQELEDRLSSYKSLLPISQSIKEK